MNPQKLQEKFKKDIEKIAGLLGGIDHKCIAPRYTANNKIVFGVFDNTIGKISLDLWKLNCSLEFWFCNFAESIVTDGVVNTKLKFQNCIFEKSWFSKLGCFKKEVEFIECTFLQSIDFSKSTFEEKMCFYRSNINGQAFFTETHFLYKTIQNLADKDWMHDYEYCFKQNIFAKSVDFNRASFNASVDFCISKFEGEARFLNANFYGKNSEKHGVANFFKECIFEKKAIFDGASFSEKVDFGISRFEDEASFVGVGFDANSTKDNIVENNFEGSIFYEKTSFEKAKFQGRVDFRNSRFKDETKFVGVDFLGIAPNKPHNNFAENDFSECVFEKYVAFGQNTFNGRINFALSSISNALFSKVHFQEKCKDEEWFIPSASFKNATFINCSFPESVEFVQCNFIDCNFLLGTTANNEKIGFEKVIFTSSIFKGTNNFDDGIFHQNPVLTNNIFNGEFKINQDLLKYPYKILEKIIGGRVISNQTEKNPSIWRDLFRQLKSNRLAHHNVIDASELHTQELYARELELVKRAKQKEVSFKEKIEKWQLWFYRITSDHHTDLALIFNNVIVLIALFGFFASVLLCLAPSPEPSIMRFVQENGGVLSIFDLEALSLQSKSPKIERQIQWFCSLIACIGFVGIYLGLITATNWLRGIRKKWSKVCLYGFYIFVYCASFALLFYKPPLLLPIIGKFFDESLKLNFAPLQSLCIVYYILMILMLFSLQKTARKNSIIPS